MKKILPFLLLATTAFLLFKNLGNIYLWEDEAETAVIANNLWTTGYPTPFDGKNLVTQMNGEDIAVRGNHYLWRLHPWLQYYLLAPFLHFKKNTFFARLPFVLLGLAAIYLIYLTAKKLFSERIALFALFISLFCWPLLVYIRQARYYSLLLFFSILLIYLYLHFLEKRKRAWLWFSIAAIFLFHSHFVAFFGTITGLWIHFLLFYWRKIKEYLKELVWIFSSIAIFTLPWFWLVDYFALFSRSSHLSAFGDHLQFYSSVFLSIFPICLLCLGFLLCFSNCLKYRQEILLLVFVGLTTTLTVSFFIPVPYTRYLIGLFPILIILTAAFLDWILKKNLFWGSLALFLIFLHFFTPWPWLLENKGKGFKNNWGFFSYLSEITHDYDGPVEAIVNFLNQSTKKNPTVLTNYAWEPIIFYTNAKVLNRITDPSSPLFPLTKGENPDFIIPRHCWKPMQIPANYRKIVLSAKDICWENRSEPLLHHFRTVTTGPNVVIYQRE